MYTKTIDVISHTHAISQATISQVLALPEEALSHGGTFTGKPSTRLHCSDDYVLKINRNLNFSSQELAMAWATKQHEKEQESKLYPPEKTWFVQQTDQGWTAANISPRLQVIHTIIEGVELKRKIEYLFAITSLYLSYGAKEHERLDEGLSNFGIDKHGKMYYIDDDFYAWDHLLSFANMVALWIRLFSSSWLDSKAAYVLGSIIKKQLHLHFSEHAGVDYPAVLIEHLKQQFYNEQSKICMLSMCSALMPQLEDTTTVTQPLLAPDAQIVTSWFSDAEPMAVISDIHANLPALNAVLDDIQAQGITRIFCLGDIVGYGPHPSECIRRLQQENIFTIRGNHDYMVGSGKDFSHGSKSSLHVAKWTMQVISKREKKWLKTLPLQLRDKDVMLVHGAPRDPTFFNAYVYERTAEPNLQWMEAQNLPMCFHGHSHLQGMYVLQAGQVSLQKELDIAYPLAEHTASLICSGAVGQPRNGIPGAEYAVYDPLQKAVTFKRLDYDIAQVVEDMKKFAFPEQLSTRLEQGF